MAKTQVIVYIKSAVIEVEEEILRKYQDNDPEAIAVIEEALETKLKSTSGPHIEYLEEL